MKLRLRFQTFLKVVTNMQQKLCNMQYTKVTQYTVKAFVWNRSTCIVVLIRIKGIAMKIKRLIKLLFWSKSIHLLKRPGDPDPRHAMCFCLIGEIDLYGPCHTNNASGLHYLAHIKIFAFCFYSLILICFRDTISVNALLQKNNTLLVNQ